MSTAHVVMETSPTLEDVHFLEDRLYDHNVEQIGLDDGQEYAFFVRDEHQDIRAGVAGLPSLRITLVDIITIICTNS